MEARVVLAITVLIGLSLAFVLIVTTRAVTSEWLERASDDLAVARIAFYRLVATRTAFAAAQTRLITVLPIFRAHMTDVRLASDQATLDGMAEEYRSQLDASFCIVTDRHGKWIGSPGWPAAEPPPTMLSGIDAALTGRPQHHIAAIGDRLFLVVSEPARFAEETLGSLTAGYLLDDAVAEELSQITHSEVNLVARTGISGSSLPESARAQLRALLSTMGAAENDDNSAQNEPGVFPVTREIGGVPYVTGAFSLFPDRTSDGIGQLVLLQDWRPTQQFLDDLRQRLLFAGLLTFALAVAGGVIFSRRMSSPFKDIADAASDLASGNWMRQVPIRGSVEAMTMATSFNEMSSHLRHWHEQAEARAGRLQASYERFHSVTESARDGIVSTNKEGAITFWNRSAAAIFVCAEEEALGTPLTTFIAEADRQTYLDALAFAPAGPVLAGRTLDLMGARRDGTLFPVELSLSVSRTEEASMVTAVVRDATERKQAEAALHHREAELRQAQKMEAIGLLAGGVAHDFNNLLTAIMGYGELVIETLDVDDARRSDVDEILKASVGAAGLTRQLLAFSRRQVLAPRVLALDAIVAGTEKMLGRLIGEDIELSSETEPDLGRVRADPGQVEQVLINLVVNARDAMPEGGKIHITLANVEVGAGMASARLGVSPGRYVRLAVTDTGCGMTPETVARIFEPFFTTKGEGKGTGLGLSTAYGIVQQSGGSLEVESSVGHGTTFRVYLPQCAEDEVAVLPEERLRLSTRGSETVLLVEDDDQVRGLVRTMLRQQGYTVLDASGGDQALEIVGASTAAIHLLLTDVVMPNMNGRVLAERLTALHPDTRVLFMSGYSDDAVLRAGIETAGALFIAKPFSKEALTGKLREVLERPVMVW